MAKGNFFIGFIVIIVLNALLYSNDHSTALVIPTMKESQHEAWYRCGFKQGLIEGACISLKETRKINFYDCVAMMNEK